MSIISVIIRSKLKPLLVYYLKNNTSYIESQYTYAIRNLSYSCSKSFLNKHVQIKDNILNKSIQNSLVLYSQSRSFMGLWGKPPKTEKIELSNQTITSEREVDKLDSNVISNTPTIDSNGYIPEPPPIPLEEAILNSLGEPALKSIGLASNWTPVGWVQQILELIHVEFDLPWFQTIVFFTIIVRTLLLPLTIKIQKNAAIMKNITPQMTELNKKLSDARMTGNALEIAKAMHQYSEFLRTHNFGLKNFFLPMSQAPVVISTFLAIRNMCKLPVESMQNGGISWFENLTVSDPFYILPVASCFTLYIILARGIETGQSAEAMKPAMRMFIKVLPCVLFPFFINLPSGTMLYVCSTNFYSLIVATIVKIPIVRKKLKMPMLDESTKQKLSESQKKTKGLIKEMRESMKNTKLVNELEERSKLRASQFDEAGRGLPIKTYKTNPKLKK